MVWLCMGWAAGPRGSSQSSPSKDRSSSLHCNTWPADVLESLDTGFSLGNNFHLWMPLLFLQTPKLCLAGLWFATPCSSKSQDVFALNSFRDATFYSNRHSFLRYERITKKHKFICSVPHFTLYDYTCPFSNSIYFSVQPYCSLSQKLVKLVKLHLLLWQITLNTKILIKLLLDLCSLYPSRVLQSSLVFITLIFK